MFTRTVFHSALGRKRLQRGSIDGGIERGTGTFPLAERTLIHALQEFRQGLVEIGEGEEFFVAQYGDQPALCQEHGRLHFSFVTGFVGTRRHNRNPVKLCHLEVGAIQIGLIAAGASDTGAWIVRHDQLTRALEELKGQNVTLDPVGKVLAERASRKGVGAGAKRSHEERGRFGFAAFAIVDGNGGAGPIHEHLFAGTVLLA
jgi:hypothetical protein